MFIQFPFIPGRWRPKLHKLDIPLSPLVNSIESPTISSKNKKKSTILKIPTN